MVRAAGVPLIVCNDSWRLAPWAEALVAMDTAWWRQHGATIAEQFDGVRFGFTSMAQKWGASHSAYGKQLHHFGNTGAAAIALAVRSQAATVLLVGYDAIPDEDGALHWHGSHAAPLKNPEASMHRWPAQFEVVAEHARRHRVQVINCSRRTVLQCFERMTLEEALRIQQSSATSGSSTSEASGTRTHAAPPSASATAPFPLPAG